MKYLVMECHPAYAVVLDEEGRFLKVANFDYEVGQTVTNVVTTRSYRSTGTLRRVVPTLALVACLALVLLLGWYCFLVPCGSVRLSINPDMQIIVNRAERVISVKALNSSAEALITGYSGFGKTVQTTVDELSDLAIAKGYLQSGNTVYITVSSADAQWIHSTRDAVVEKLQAHLGEDYLVIGRDEAEWSEPDPSEPSGPSDPSDPTKPTDGDDDDDDHDDDDDDKDDDVDDD